MPQYIVKSGCTCYHAGIEYTEGDALPSTLSTAELNVHLPSVEILDITFEFPPDKKPTIQNLHTEEVID